VEVCGNFSIQKHGDKPRDTSQAAGQNPLDVVAAVIHDDKDRIASSAF
jgi:hypothetical protein